MFSQGMLGTLIQNDLFPLSFYLTASLQLLLFKLEVTKLYFLVPVQ